MNTALKQLPKLTAELVRSNVKKASNLNELALALNVAEAFAFDVGINVDEFYDLHDLPYFGGEPDTRGYSWDPESLLVYVKYSDVSEWAVRARVLKTAPAAKKPLPASFKIEFYPEGDSSDSLSTVLIRDAGVEGFEKAKERAKAKSLSTGTVAYMVGSDEDGESLGHISYNDGRVAERAGCFA